MRIRKVECSLTPGRFLWWDFMDPAFCTGHVQSVFARSGTFTNEASSEGFTVATSLPHRCFSYFLRENSSVNALPGADVDLVWAMSIVEPAVVSLVFT